MENVWGITGLVVALLVGIGVSMVGLSPPEFTIAKVCFWTSAVMLGATGLVWAFRTQQPSWWRISASVGIWICVGIGLPESVRWVSRRQQLLLISSVASSVHTPGIIFSLPTVAPTDPPKTLKQQVLTHPHASLPSKPTEPKTPAANLNPEPAPELKSPRSAEKPPVADPLQLSDSRAKLIGDYLLSNPAVKGSLRVIAVGGAHKDLSAQLTYQFHNIAGWQTDSLATGSMSMAGFVPNEAIYVISPNITGPSASAVLAALSAAGITAATHPELPTLGPASLGIPDVTIVLQ